MRDKSDPRNQSHGTISSVEEDNLVFARNGSEEKISLALIEKAIIAI
jgi:ribosome maturation factor RimP